MSTRERILAIKVIEMVQRQPVYAAAIGIEVVLESCNTELEEEPP